MYSNPSSITFLNWNVRSINNKVDKVMTYIIDQDISIAFISESWITESNNNITATIKSYGYGIIHNIRDIKGTNKTKGGGVAILYKKLYNLTKVKINHGKSFESVSAKFKSSNGENVFCCCIYQPDIISDLFFSELDEFIGNVFIKFERILISGDLNIHLDAVNSKESIKFADIISSYGLVQHVNHPTHASGHWLDVVISSNKIVKDDKTSICKLNPEIFSTNDHFPVKFELDNNVTIPSVETKTICFRNIGNISVDIFRNDLSSSLTQMTVNSSVSFENTIEIFNEKCKTVLDMHAPILNKKIRDRTTAPWFDGEYKSLRNLRRKAEHNQHKSQHHKEVYKSLREQCNTLASQKKHAFFKSQFEKHNNSPKSLFKFMNTFMDKEK